MIVDAFAGIRIPFRESRYGGLASQMTGELDRRKTNQVFLPGPF
jgi:hypothetical protein